MDGKIEKLNNPGHHYTQGYYPRQCCAVIVGNRTILQEKNMKAWYFLDSMKNKTTAFLLA